MQCSSTTQPVAGHATAPIVQATIDAWPATITNGTNFSVNVFLPSGTNVLAVATQDSTGVTSLKRFSTATTGSAPTALTYDLNGNTVTDESGNSYQWDALNRLTKITYPSTAYSTFAYDGLSRRTQIAEYNSTHVLTSTKNYLWIGQEMAEERDATNTVQKRFFAQGEQQSGTNYYYTRDHLSSVREMMGSTGISSARYGYDPYGRTTLLSGSNLATKQYTGDYYHATSGLDLTIYRAYDSNPGRWINRDPIQEKGGLNLYVYGSDSPINILDPVGLSGGVFNVVTAPTADPAENPYPARSVSYRQDCPRDQRCAHIQFIQIVKDGILPYKVDYPSGGQPADNAYPFYKWGKQSIGPGNASLPDNPGWTIPISQEFETCAICMETGKILGCHKWGIGGSGPHGFEPNSPVTPPSNTFNTLINGQGLSP